jgi:periplasmic copper chaperone A
MTRKLIVILGTAAALALTATPAWAHVVAIPGEGPASGFHYFQLEVGHGCEDSPTTALSVRMPEGVGSVTPEEEPGWEVSTSGSEDDVSGVTWTATGAPLDAHHLALFGMSVQLPDGDVGETVYFPTVQRCEEGATRWIEIPAEGETADDLESPAPAIVLTEAGGGHGAEESEEAEGAPEAAADDLTSEPAAATEEGTDALTWVALAIGVLGIVMGGAALARSRG